MDFVSLLMFVIPVIISFKAFVLNDVIVRMTDTSFSIFYSIRDDKNLTQQIA